MGNSSTVIFSSCFMPLLDSRVEDSWDVCSQNAAYMSWGRASVTYKQCIYMSMLLELLSFDHDSELSSVWPPFQHFSVETEFFVVPWPSRKTTLSPIHRRDATLRPTLRCEGQQKTVNNRKQGSSSGAPLEGGGNSGTERVSI